MKWFHSLKSLTSSKKHWTLVATSDEIRTCNENDEFDHNKPRTSLLNASNKMSPSMSVANLFVTDALSTTSLFSSFFSETSSTNLRKKNIYILRSMMLSNKKWNENVSVRRFVYGGLATPEKLVTTSRKSRSLGKRVLRCVFYWRCLNNVWPCQSLSFCLLHLTYA
jgi:hypothetical protein